MFYNYFQKRSVTRVVAMAFTLLCFSLVLSACKTSPQQQIQDTDNPTVKLLEIRKFTFQGRYKLAERLYNEVKNEYPLDKALQVQIDYEIAFLYVKRKKYKDAKPLFETIISRYDLDEESHLLPQWPYYLSKKILEDVVEYHLNYKPTLWHRLAPPA